MCIDQSINQSISQLIDNKKGKNEIVVRSFNEYLFYFSKLDAGIVLIVFVLDLVREM